MSEESHKYYTFHNADEVAFIIDLWQINPELAQACIHLAQGKINNNQFPLTDEDVAALVNAEIEYEEETGTPFDGEMFATYGRAILQLLEDKVLPPPIQTPKTSTYNGDYPQFLN